MFSYNELSADEPSTDEESADEPSTDEESADEPSTDGLSSSYLSIPIQSGIYWNKISEVRSYLLANNLNG